LESTAAQTPGRADFLLSKGSRAAVNAQDDMSF